MKQQVIYINGGVPKENFSGGYYHYLKTLDYNPYEENFVSWNKTLGERLGPNWEFFRAPFAERGYADYSAWKIMFEKMIPYMNEEIILISSSLGSTFIIKYLGENDGIVDIRTGKKIRIKKIFFIAPALEDTKQEKLGTFEIDIEKIYSRITRWCKIIYIYHSHDDTVVPFEQGLKLNSYFPEAIFREFYDRGHFYLEAELPEIIDDILN